MSQPPPQPKIYHITHVANLANIVMDGGLLSDATILQRGGPAQTVGMAEIKTRRLVLPVECHLGDHVGDYVPFYFCPRSVMLYLLHRGNHPGLNYKGGQAPIVHLEADMEAVIDWASQNQQRWAFSLSNAGALYTKFRNDPANLTEIDWEAVANNDFRTADVKEGKQAEFLVHRFFPWHLISRIGVHSNEAAQAASAAFALTPHRPTIEIKREWYF